MNLPVGLLTAGSFTSNILLEPFSNIQKSLKNYSDDPLTHHLDYILVNLLQSFNNVLTSYLLTAVP